MKTLDVNAKLFTELEKIKPNWWNNLLSEKGVYVDVRKNNYIDIYFNGGNIIRELKYDGKNFSGSINYKYLLSEKSKYIKYDFITPNVNLAQNNIELLTFKGFKPDSLKRIKANISKYYPASSEKGIQAGFVNHADCFLDTEFAYNYQNKKLRIDLVWIDTTNKKILLVELKTTGDRRLFDGRITDQLKKYHDFAIKFKPDIEDYYIKVFEIKKRLNILPQGLKSISSLKGYTLEVKPLLLLGDCEQKWIDKLSEGIDKDISKIAIGAYYFGGTKYDCDLIPKSKRNRHIF